MKSILLLILLSLVAGVGLAGCSKKEEAAAPSTDQNSGNPLSAPADYLGTLNKAQKSAQKTTSTVSLQNAIASFHTEKGRFPKDLNELVSGEYISSLPKPPAGMKFNYDATAGTVSVVAE